MDNPHFSTGAGGNIVKARTTCHGVAEVRIAVSLYRCPRKPEGDKEEWPGQRCAIVKAGGRKVKPPVDGTTYTTYAPPTGSAGAHGVGWYIRVAIVTKYNSGGRNTGLKTTIGNPVHLAS